LDELSLSQAETYDAANHKRPRRRASLIPCARLSTILGPHVARLGCAAPHHRPSTSTSTPSPMNRAQSCMPRNLAHSFRRAKSTRCKQGPTASSPLPPAARPCLWLFAGHMWGVDKVTLSVGQTGPRLDVPFLRFSSSPAVRVWRPLSCAGRQCSSPSGADSALGDITYRRLYDSSLEMFRQPLTDTCPRVCKRSVSVSAACQALCTKRQSPGPLLPEADAPKRCCVLGWASAYG
jgi:hypothetical protein